MKILAIDPGETTGVAVCEIGDTMGTFRVIDHKSISLWRGIDFLLDVHHPDVIVAELFRLYPQCAKAQSFSSMVASRVIGAVEYIAEKRGITLVEQSAAVGTKIHLPKHIFSEIGKGKTPHEVDATKHAYAYCLGKGIKEQP